MFKKLYLHLFNRVTDAIELLEEGKKEEAEKKLKAAQMECEAMYAKYGRGRSYEKYLNIGAFSHFSIDFVGAAVVNYPRKRE